MRINPIHCTPLGLATQVDGLGQVEASRFPVNLQTGPSRVVGGEIHNRPTYKYNIVTSGYITNQYVSKYNERKHKS